MEWVPPPSICTLCTAMLLWLPESDSLVLYHLTCALKLEILINILCNDGWLNGLKIKIIELA